MKITQNTKNAESQNHDVLRTRNIIILIFWKWILFRKVNVENFYLISYNLDCAYRINSVDLFADFTDCFDGVFNYKIIKYGWLIYFR